MSGKKYEARYRRTHSRAGMYRDRIFKTGGEWAGAEGEVGEEGGDEASVGYSLPTVLSEEEKPRDNTSRELSLLLEENSTSVSVLKKESGSLERLTVSSLALLITLSASS